MLSSESYINIRKEMATIKERQQKMTTENYKENHRELWKLQIVWKYLRDKVTHVPADIPEYWH